MRPEIGFFVAFVASLAVGPVVIRFLRRRQFGQAISDDAPETHQKKAGTPTMGGIIILVGMLAGVLAMIIPNGVPKNLLAIALFVLAYAALGFADDYLTVHPRGGVRGIASKPKAAVQTVLAILFVFWVTGPGGCPSQLAVAHNVLLTGIWYKIFAVALMVSMTNFVNITDGLDGLAAGLTLLAAFPLALITLGHDGADVVLPGLSGACLGFLWYNANPARVFMGDTGSLTIGAALSAAAVVAQAEWVLVVAGLVFVVEGLSTAIQWAVFKYTRIRTGTGVRVFRKAPLHHHFEMCGWPEQTVVVRFWIAGVVATWLAFTVLMHA